MKDSKIIAEVKEILNDKSFDLIEQLNLVCKLLYKEKSNYDWVGFYFAEQSTKTLHLGPFAGEPTDHKVIPFGKGICGQVAESHETFLVDDVNAQDNYIACSINVKSEIVVPLFINDKNVGQIDIDSHTKDGFSDADEKLLAQINQMIGDRISDEKLALKALWI